MHNNNNNNNNNNKRCNKKYLRDKDIYVPAFSQHRLLFRFIFIHVLWRVFCLFCLFLCFDCSFRFWLYCCCFALNTCKRINIAYIFMYVWKLNQTVLELDLWADKCFVLLSTGFELTPLIHCSTNHLALCPAP